MSVPAPVYRAFNADGKATGDLRDVRSADGKLLTPPPPPPGLKRPSGNRNPAKPWVQPTGNGGSRWVPEHTPGAWPESVLPPRAKDPRYYQVRKSQAGGPAPAQPRAIKTRSGAWVRPVEPPRTPAPAPSPAPCDEPSPVLAPDALMTNALLTLVRYLPIRERIALAVQIIKETNP